MTKLEEVATALRVFVQENDGAVAREAARAAIEALREPNEAMLRAALSVLRSDLKESEASIALTTEAVLRVMIDAILSNTKEGG